ncbi:Cysteine protease ATG4D [Pelomyxa schiedti]|nr:Cysteine protease ATG4D [Pelomyxa schiedti]
MASIFSNRSNDGGLSGGGIWMHGVCFTSESTGTDPSMDSSPPNVATKFVDFNQFPRAVSRLLWFTYRCDFEPIAGPMHLTSDAGWGCTLRSAQMLLAQCLTTHLVGYDWKLSDQVPPAGIVRTIRELLRWFADTPNDWSPYSIHNLVRIGGILLGKTGTDWYGPTTAALVLQQIVAMHEPGNVVMYVAVDAAIFKDKLRLLCTTELSRGSGEPHVISRKEWKPLIVLVPVRIGIDHVNPVYIHRLKQLFKFPQCMGIMGGKPRSSLYFFAAQDNYLYYLDPHTLQPTIPISNDQLFFDTTTYFYHGTPRKIPATELDPSMTIGFFFSSESDFEAFQHDYEQFPKENSLFSILDQSFDGTKGSSEDVLALSDDEFDAL